MAVVQVSDNDSQHWLGCNRSVSVRISDRRKAWTFLYFVVAKWRVSFFYKTILEGELEEEWLKEAGLSNLFGESADDPQDSIAFLSTLTRTQAAAVQKRVETVSQTLRKKNKQHHIPDVRDIFAQQREAREKVRFFTDRMAKAEMLGLIGTNPVPSRSLQTEWAPSVYPVSKRCAGSVPMFLIEFSHSRRYPGRQIPKQVQIQSNNSVVGRMESWEHLDVPITPLGDRVGVKAFHTACLLVVSDRKVGRGMLFLFSFLGFLRQVSAE